MAIPYPEEIGDRMITENEFKKSCKDRHITWDPAIFGSGQTPEAGNTQAIVNQIYHIVLIDLLDTTSREEIDALIADGKVSIAAIPGILAVDIGFKARDDRPVHIRDYDLAVYVQLASLEAAKPSTSPAPQSSIFSDRLTFPGRTNELNPLMLLCHQVAV
jgi:hypothetical protein